MTIADTSGTITPFRADILPDYRPLTELAIKWRQLSSGNWKGLDRTSTEDIYRASFSIYGTETVINNFIDEVNSNAGADDHEIRMSSFLTTEYIFGENVDHSGNIDCTIEMPLGNRFQGSFKGWGLNLTVRAKSVSFTGSSSLPTLEHIDTGPGADANWTINKHSTYDNTYSYHDHKAPAGIFDGVFTLTTANMILIRNYIKTQRTGNFTLADNFGISYPFGSRSSNSYPFTTKLIDWEDLGHFGILYHKIRLKFAEAV